MVKVIKGRELTVKVTATAIVEMKEMVMMKMLKMPKLRKVQDTGEEEEVAITEEEEVVTGMDTGMGTGTDTGMDTGMVVDTDIGMVIMDIGIIIISTTPTLATITELRENQQENLRPIHFEQKVDLTKSDFNLNFISILFHF